jgi:hypothetical protein
LVSNDNQRTTKSPVLKPFCNQNETIPGGGNLMGKSKIDDVKLKRLLRDGKTINHCANVFDVSTQAIRKRIKVMDVVVGKSLVLDKPRADKITNEAFDAHAELRKIHGSATEMLEKLEAVQRGEVPIETLEPLLGNKGSMGDLQLKCIAEIRKQLSFMHDVHKSLLDMKQVQKFQEIILQEISSVDSATGHKIKQKLIDACVLHSSLQWT